MVWLLSSWNKKECRSIGTGIDNGSPVLVGIKVVVKRSAPCPAHPNYYGRTRLVELVTRALQSVVDARTRSTIIYPCMPM